MHSGIVLGRNFTSHGFIVSALTYSPAWLGMGIFFSLSGYLMTLGFVNSKYNLSTSGIRAFLTKRYFRIGPMTVFTFLIVTFIEFRNTSFNPFLLIQVLTFTYYGKGGAPGTGALWSMSTEWMFYLALPVLLVLVGRKSKASLYKYFIILEIGLLILRSTLFLHAGGFSAWHYLYFSLIGNIDFFFAGLMAALLPKSFNKISALKFFTMVGGLYLLYTLISYPAMGQGNGTWQAVFMIILPGVTSYFTFKLIAVCANGLGVFHRIAKIPLVFLGFFGRISLPLYLIHSEIFYLFHRHFPSWNYLRILSLALPVTICVAYLLSRSIESYFIKIGESFSAKVKNIDRGLILSKKV